MQKHHPLYVRRGDKIKGPFPEGQISQSLLLGRIALTDEISVDKDEWQPVRSRPDLIPDVLKADPDDEQVQERLQAAKRWADERRPGHEPSDDSRRPESFETLEYRQHRESVYSQLTKRKEFALIQAVLVLALGATLVYLGFIYEPQQSKTEPICDAPASPGINWSYCRMAGLQSIRSELQEANLNSAILTNANLFASKMNKAILKYADLSLSNLSYADLSGATLKGANLQNADLTQTILSQADLSYADFSGAKLEGVELTGATLDNAIWTDGRTCLVGSVGECKVSKKN